MLLLTPGWILLMLASGTGYVSDDIDMARKIRRGDKEAFRIFFDQYHKQLFFMLIGKGVRESVAEDIIQQAFLTIWEKRNEIDENKSLKGFLFRISYNRALNHFRDTKKFDDSDELPEISNNLDPADDVQERLLHEAITKALNNMPEKRRMVFEMCFMQELTYRETAEAMQLSIKTIENHMGLALKEIRASLIDFKIDS